MHEASKRERRKGGRNQFWISAVTLFLGFALHATTAAAKEIYVDSRNGRDENVGTKEAPFYSLARAIQQANSSRPTTVRVLPGIYYLHQKAEIKRDDNAGTDRFVIEAATLPDDKDWVPAKMPVVICDANNSTSYGFECSVGLMVSANHVTIRGLKFLGNPNPEVTFFYPIGRESVTLEDLEISQCVFVGEKYSSPIQVAILTNGYKTTLDHCIFYRCRNGVVFWKSEGDTRENVVSHCIIYGAYQAGVWTAHGSSSFRLYNNVITKCAFAWVKNYDNRSKFSFRDSLIADNEHYFGEWTKPDTIVAKAPPQGELQESDIVKSGTVKLVDKEGDQFSMEYQLAPKYLNLREDSAGKGLDAGLFR